MKFFACHPNLAAGGRELLGLDLDRENNLSYVRQAFSPVIWSLWQLVYRRSAVRDDVFAVLTGDFIASTAMEPEELDSARTLMRGAIDQFCLARPQAVRGPIEFFRGDAWQVLLGDPSLALRLTLLLRATLRAHVGADTRISIGIGGVDQIVQDRISMSTGEAFTLSGRALDRMTVYFDLTGALPDPEGPFARWFPTVLHLCSGLVRPWTRRQAELVALGLMLDNPTQERIANSLQPKVAKQTVQESLASAGWRPLIEAVSTFERTDWSTIAGPVQVAADRLKTLS